MTKMKNTEEFYTVHLNMQSLCVCVCVFGRQPELLKFLHGKCMWYHEY